MSSSPTGGVGGEQQERRRSAEHVSQGMVAVIMIGGGQVSAAPYRCTGNIHQEGRNQNRYIPL